MNLRLLNRRPLKIPFRCTGGSLFSPYALWNRNSALWFGNSALWLRHSAFSLYVLGFLLSLFITIPGYAQTESADSLTQEIFLTLDEESHATALNQLAIKLRDSDPVNSMNYVDAALIQGRKLNNHQEVAASLSLKGYLLAAQNDYISALNCYLASLDTYMKIKKDEKEIALLHYRIGMIYKTLGSYDKALEHSLLGLKVCESIDDTRSVALIYRVMGSIFKYKGEFEKSLYYYFNGLKINEDLDDIQGVANAFNNIGIVYFMMENHEKALEYYRMSLSLNNENNNENEASINLGNIGAVYLDLNILDSAWHYINLRYASAARLNNKRIIAATYNSFGDYYLKLNDYNKSYDFYTRSLCLARELGVLETCKENLLNISQLLETKADYENALNYFRMYVDLRDSLFNSEVLQRFDQMELDYKYEKEKNINMIRQQKTRLYTIMGFAASLLSILLLLLIFMNQRVRLKKNDLIQKGLELEKQQLQSEVDFKDREMFSKTVSIIDKTEIINYVSRQLKKIISNTSENVRPIKQIIRDLEFHANTKIWDEFEYTFLNVHPGFFDRLDSRFPGLTPNEKRLCVFIKLNLATKDIASITQKTNHSITVARTRLRKKLGLSNTGESLSAFLSKF